MVTSYKKSKEKVLEIYNEFLEIVSKAEVSEDDTSLKALAIQAEKIKEDRFCLMIAGEAKSGKSTFINAYLKTEILPMDVKQCTSSVVEIMYGKEFMLFATYADGREEKIAGEDLIKKFLAENAAIDDEYRDIPTPVINNELLVKKQGKKILEQEIVDLLEGVKNENIHKLSVDDYNEKIRKYISERQPRWKEIVTKMIIQYPFPDDDLKGVHIVDSPGVHAAGRVGDVTETYIESADAIMFLRPITGQAIEANSFKDFLETKSVDRNKNAMFLILTRKAAESDEVIERAYEEYINMFGAHKGDNRHGIVREQIIPVDSKAELYYNEFQALTTEEIKSHLKELKENKKSEPFVRAAWMDADEDKEAFLNELRQYSNFDAINNALNKFGRKAQFLALSEFLARILKTYEKIGISIKEKIKYYELKAEDPSKLAVSVSETKTALVEIENKMNVIVDEITEKYAGRGEKGLIAKEAETVLKEYKEEIDAIEGSSASSLEKLEKCSFRYVDKFTEYERELQKKVIEECNNALIELSSDDSVEFVELEPDLTPEIIEKIKDDMKENDDAYDYKSGKSFSKSKKIPEFSQSKYYGLVKNSISERLGNIKQKVIRDLRSFVTKTATAYTKELAKNADIKRTELSEIVQRKQTAEETAETIQQLRTIVELIDPSIEKVKEYKGGIDCNV